MTVRMAFATWFTLGSGMLMTYARETDGPAMDMSLKEQVKTYMDTFNDSEPGDRRLIQIDPKSIQNKMNELDVTIECVSIEDLLIIECCTEGYGGACEAICNDVDLSYSGDDHACSCEIEVTSSTTATCTGSCSDATYIDCSCSSCDPATTTDSDDSVSTTTSDSDDGVSPTPVSDDEDETSTTPDGDDVTEGALQSGGSLLTLGFATMCIMVAMSPVTTWVAGMQT